MRIAVCVLAIVATGADVRPARADEPATPLSETSPDAPDAPVGPPAAVHVVVRGRRPWISPAEASPSSRVTRRDLDQRLPRSAPDALRYEPGVFVQQTAHGQGSAFIRGRTGQQTVLMFDGIRLNTSTWRQGPNQYFFTVDSHSIHHIDVIRGGASTRFGSDAIGGVIEAHPLEPRLTLGREGPVLLPRTMVRYASADQEFGQRFQLDAQVDPSLRALAGVGYRRVGQLESGGPVRSPTTGEIPQVPAFESDGRTQLGTGFDELTGDLRVVRQLGDDTRVVAATYAYRQYDSPRTDQCPPPFAPRDECMKYDEQFRTLAYMAIDGRYGGLARTLRAAVSIQRQHERRTRVRPASFVENGGRDDVNTFGAMLRATSDDTTVGANGRARLTYGGDVYHDRVDSTAWTVFTDLPRVIPSSRGQYLNDAHYTQGGVFVEPSFDLGTTLTVRAGSRGGGAQAFAPSDPESGTSGIDRGWTSLVGYGGVIVRPVAPLSAILNVDRSFRAPNLDDLTSRQQTGPGFQFENPNLRPEVALTFESGLRWRDQALEAEAWVFRSLVDEAIERVLRTSADCPAATPQCQASWSRFQLVNASGTAVVEGVELAARLALPSDFVAQASLSATRGETDNSQQRPTDPTLPYEERVPLSRIPPVHGSGELRWDPDGGVYAGASVRWALLQDKLAPSDLSDARIPKGGTPGFLVVDLTAGYRFERELVFNIVLENLGDTAYRYHGSSVNGPGRGVIVNMEAGL